MPKEDKHRFLPLLAVIICGFGLAILVRLLVIESGRDNGTANLTFILVFAGFMLAYLLFMVAWEPLFLKVFGKMLTPKPRLDDQPKEDATPIEQPESEIVPEPASTPKKTPVRKEKPASTPAIVAANVEPEATEEAVEQPKIVSKRAAAIQLQVETFAQYSRKTFSDYTSRKDIELLETYIAIYAHRKDDPIKTKINTTGLTTFDLYHYGWNMWNHFKVTKQPEVAEWLYSVFSALKDVDLSTIEHNLKHKANKGIIRIQKEID